jgi:hypothetical protein
MSKSKQTREIARAMVNPLFAWTNAMLKGGELMLDSMGALAKNARSVRVAVLPEAEAPARKQASRTKSKAGAKRARRRR